MVTETFSVCYCLHMSTTGNTAPLAAPTAFTVYRNSTGVPVLVATETTWKAAYAAAQALAKAYGAELAERTSDAITLSVIAGAVTVCRSGTAVCFFALRAI